VTFSAELHPPGFYEGAHAWSVDAEIAVRCDHLADCGMHRIESREAPILDTPADAVAALDEFTDWLVVRSREVPLSVGEMLIRWPQTTDPPPWPTLGETRDPRQISALTAA
jgi:hypothetical protein